MLYASRGRATQNSATRYIVVVCAKGTICSMVLYIVGRGYVDTIYCGTIYRARRVRVVQYVVAQDIVVVYIRIHNI